MGMFWALRAMRKRIWLRDMRPPNIVSLLLQRCKRCSAQLTGNECGHTCHGNDPRVNNTSSAGKVKQGQETDQVHENEGVGWDAPRVCPSKDLGSQTLDSQTIEGSRANIQGTVDGRKHGDEDDGVDGMCTSCSSDSSKGNDERRPGSLALCRKQIGVVVRDRKSQKEYTEQKDANDSPKNALDSLGNVLSRVLGLSGSQTNHLGTAVHKRSKGKDLEDALDTVRKGTRIVVKLETHLFTADGARGDEDGAEEEGEDGNDLGQSEPEFGFTEGLDTEESKREEDSPV